MSELDDAITRLNDLARRNREDFSSFTQAQKFAGESVAYLSRAGLGTLTMAALRAVEASERAGTAYLDLGERLQEVQTAFNDLHAENKRVHAELGQPLPGAKTGEDTNGK